MMKSLGHEVFLYSSEIADDVATEHITCITEKERTDYLGDTHYVSASFDTTLPHWVKFNSTVVDEIKKRRQPKDFICLIGGIAHKPIADALPDMMTVEFGIGYPGTFAKYRVFESYAWMHTVYGSSNSNPGAINGEWFDEVIPNYFDLNEFPYQAEKEDYYVYIGRMIDRKGYKIAQEVCEHMGVPLKLAGPGGDPGGYGEYVGVVGPQERAELVGKAKATFVPTIYVEPFGGVVIESHLYGTPTLTTDWGAFTEINLHGVTGYRCRTMQQFVDAAKKAPKLNTKLIRKTAEKYSLDNVAKQYQDYFARLLTLWDDGWYNVK